MPLSAPPFHVSGQKVRCFIEFCAGALIWRPPPLGQGRPEPGPGVGIKLRPPAGDPCWLICQRGRRWRKAASSASPAHRGRGDVQAVAIQHGRQLHHQVSLPRRSCAC